MSVPQLDRLESGDFERQLEARGATNVRAYRTRDGGWSLIVSRDPFGTLDDGSPDYRWHLSLRAPGRVPTWEELVEIAHRYRPGVPMVAGIPPRSQWMNMHPDVLHLWQTKDENLIAQWRFEGRGDTPT